MEVVPYGGWQRCARFVLGKVEMLVTLEVGPRVIRLGFLEGENELKEYAPQMGQTGGQEYRSYGGHRLWIGPEDPVRTMQPDNEEVEHSEDGEWQVFRIKPDRFGMQKEMAIALDEIRHAFRLRHRIYNRGESTNRFAPWTITVMAPGGECLVPQAPYQPHTENLLPVRPLVLWSYTRLDDPRYTLGPDLIRLRHHPEGGNQKIGMPVEQGYAAYANHGNLFIKRFDHQPDADYPDFGCNFETFTRQDMLEVESLGPMQSLESGGYAEHFETWYLEAAGQPPLDTAEAGRWLEKLARDRPFLR